MIAGIGSPVMKRRTTIPAAFAVTCADGVPLSGVTVRTIDFPAMNRTREYSEPEPIRPSGEIPLAGSITLRVRYVECDPMNVAHHSSYVAWLEMGRTELLREGGVSYADLERAGVFLVVTKLELKYRRPIFYDDLVEIRTRAHAAGRIKIRHTYDIVLVERAGKAPEFGSDPRVPADGVCAIASTEIACVGSDGRPRPLPDWLVSDG